jgi:hypothetical protein
MGQRGSPLKHTVANILEAKCHVVEADADYLQGWRKFRVDFAVNIFCAPQLLFWRSSERLASNTP